MSVGKRYAPEWREERDPQTGRRVIQLTDSNAEDYHLYFYNPTVTRDGKYLVFTSERTGISNLFRLDLGNGEIVQLTDAAPAPADYYLFTYTPLRGVAACLPALGAGGSEVFYFVGNELFAARVDSLECRHVASLPTERRPSILNFNAAGTVAVLATVDHALFAERAPRTYAGEHYPSDPFYEATTSTILRLDLQTGQLSEIWRRERFWVNHVLVNPTNPDLILFCHEYSELPDRMWLLDVSTGEYEPIPGQGGDEWYQHEFWSGDGRRVCFHGGAQHDPEVGFCGWYELETGRYDKFYHRTPGRAYAHYNLHPFEPTMITDGEAHPGGISRVHLAGDKQEFELLCRHDSYKFDDDQRCHPHPSFTPDGKQVVFTSNRTGSSNVYLVEW